MKKQLGRRVHFACEEELSREKLISVHINNIVKRN